MPTARERELRNRGMDPGMATVVANAERENPRDPMSADPTPAGVRTAISDEGERRAGRTKPLPVGGKNKVRSLLYERQEVQNPHSPSTRMLPGQSTFVQTDDGAMSARAPSPQDTDATKMARARSGPNSLAAMQAEAREYGIDPAAYADDPDELGKHVRRERKRLQGRMKAGQEPTPNTFRYDQVKDEYVPDTYRFTNTADGQRYKADLDRKVAVRQTAREIRDREGQVLGPQAREHIKYLEDIGDLEGLRAYRKDLADDRRTDIAKNVYDRRQNATVTSDLQSPTRGPGFVYRTLADSSPAQRSALYRVLGWGDAAEAETQAQIAQDAYNTQAAIASQQSGAAAENPDDDTVAGQAKRHHAMLDRMLQSNDPNDIQLAINAHTHFYGQAYKLPVEAARDLAQPEVADMLIRRGGMYAQSHVARARLADQAQKDLKSFLQWATTVGWSPEYAQEEYRKLRGEGGRPASSPAGVNPITGR